MFRTKATSYAILAAADAARRSNGSNGATIHAASTADLYGLPPTYAARIMSQLAQARVLRSDCGPSGGYQLARPADKITLLEIYEAVHGQIYSDARLFPEDQVDLGKPFEDAVQAIRSCLGAVTLADLVREEKRGRSRGRSDQEEPKMAEIA